MVDISIISPESLANNCRGIVTFRDKVIKYIGHNNLI
jgi:hypothetical protein